MSANQRKNKNKKKKAAEARDCNSTGSSIIQHVEEPATIQSSLQVEVLFTGRKGSTTGCNKVYMCASDFKALGLQTGRHVMVRIPADDDSSTAIEEPDDTRQSFICQAWVSSEAMKHTVSLTRFWQPNFPDDHGRSAVVARLSPTVAVLQCSVASFSIRPTATTTTGSSFSIDEIAASSAFRRYFVAALCDTVLCVNNVFSVSWRGEPLTVQFLEAQAAGTAPQSSSATVTYKLGALTTLRLTETSSNRDRSPLHEALPLTPSTPSYFGGYGPQREQVWALVRLGLGLDVDGKSPPPSSGLPGSMFTPPKGLLLYGPRGTGKTLLMQEVAAQLGAECHVLHVSHDILLSKFQGEAEATLQRLFEEAALNAPCLLLIDDVELLCPQRTQLLSDLQRRIVSCMLTLIDGVVDTSSGIATRTSNVTQAPSSTSRRIFIVATSSQPSLIDTAMRRPGRLDREVELSVPSPSSRGEILKALLCTMGAIEQAGRVSSTAESDLSTTTCAITDDFIQSLAQKSHGMVGADLLLVCKEAHMTALDRVSGLPHRLGHNIAEMSSDVDYSSAASTTKKQLSNQEFTGDDIEDLSSELGSRLHVGDQQAEPSTPVTHKITRQDLLSALGRVTPSAIREVAIEVPEVRWGDIGGMESVKQSLREVVEWPLLHPELFVMMKIAPPRGVLLYGPPGCSKTLMAKALATESGMNFLAVRGPELLSKWLGDSEKAVQTLFRRARAAAPSLIFFDEIDAFATKRGDSSVGVNDRVLSQLLTEIDGVQQTTARVVVVAATNRPDMLDAALLRPGRIDRKVPYFRLWKLLWKFVVPVVESVIVFLDRYTSLLLTVPPGSRFFATT
mmetsp:Transcript_6915/g.13241  ORF Transcript_6915/g.13241 Transcript_6915/m.13241 type:complete len:846 (-) Transcript_6915:294-2831(-)